MFTLLVVVKTHDVGFFLSLLDVAFESSETNVQVY